MMRRASAVGDENVGDFLQLEDFEPHVGKVVCFKGTRFAFPLERILTNDRPVPEGVERRPFTLIFVGPKERGEHLPEGHYECEIEDGPTYQIYVNPIHTPQPDRQEYQAVFN